MGVSRALCGGYAEDGALGIVDALDVDWVDFVVVDDVHPVVGYAEDDEWHQRHHQAACGSAREEQRGKEQPQPQVLGAEAHAHGRYPQPHGEDADCC